MLYIENCSIMNDLKLIFMTFKVIFLAEEHGRV
jgi:lipopolysaccharide/colanic/teichoic acid biosynthesis glycosyltransferase